MSESGGDRGTSSWQSEALQYLDALYGFAMTLTHSKAESEDLVQETYMRAMQHYESLRPDSNLKAWLFTILRNVWFKKLRRKRNAPEVVSYDEDNSAIQVADPSDPQSVLFRIWERDEVRSALAQMPQHFAEIIVLRDIEEFSYKELARVLDCPVGTVMSRLSRARTRFKQVLIELQQTPSAKILMKKQ